MGGLSWGEPGGSFLEWFMPSVTLMESFCLVDGEIGTYRRDRGEKSPVPCISKIKLDLLALVSKIAQSMLAGKCWGNVRRRLVNGPNPTTSKIVQSMLAGRYLEDVRRPVKGLSLTIGGLRDSKGPSLTLVSRK